MNLDQLSQIAVDGRLILVLLLAGIAAATAVGVVVFGNAVRSATCLVLNFFTLAFLYFTLSSELLGVTQVIVYTGAIMVLFLFVIMLLNLGSIGSSGRPLPAADDVQIITLLDEKPEILRKALGLLFGLGFFSLIAMLIVLPFLGQTTYSAPEGFGSPQAVGRALFTGYVWPFEVASILLVIGIVGSILLAKRRI